MDNNLNPLGISIVIPTNNSETTIARALNSINRQEYPNLEIIIIDNVSSDTTLSIISSLNITGIKIICEPDMGIYDAYNKGIQIASKDYIICMSSTDEFFGDAFYKFNERIHNIGSKPDIVVTAAFTYSDNGKFVNYWVPNVVNADSCLFSMPFNHQAMYVRREAYIKFGLYSEEFKLAGDRDWIFNAERNGAVFHYLSIVTSKFYLGGASADYNAVIREISTIISRHKHLDQELACVIYKMLEGRRLCIDNTTKARIIAFINTGNVSSQTSQAILSRLYILTSRLHKFQRNILRIKKEFGRVKRRIVNLLPKIQCQIDLWKLKRFNKKIIVCPQGIGDTLLTLYFSNSVNNVFLMRDFHKSLLGHLFPEKHIMTVSRAFLKSLSAKFVYNNQKINNNIVWSHFIRDYEAYLTSNYENQQKSFVLHFYSSLLSNLDNPNKIQPLNSSPQRKNDAILLCPDANSIREPPIELWTNLYHALEKFGYTVYLFTSKPYDASIYNVVPDGEIAAKLESCALIINLRSGISDICAYLGNRQIVLQPDSFLFANRDWDINSLFETHSTYTLHYSEVNTNFENLLKEIQDLAISVIPLHQIPKPQISPLSAIIADPTPTANLNTLNQLHCTLSQGA